jgi:hypothetical protein
MTPAEKLTDAEAKYHLLVTGQMARVIVDSNGERVEFTVANAGQLLKYIEGLKAQVNGTTKAPMRVFF